MRNMGLVYYLIGFYDRNRLFTVREYKTFICQERHIGIVYNKLKYNSERFFPPSFACQDTMWPMCTGEFLFRTLLFELVLFLLFLVVDFFNVRVLFRNAAIFEERAQVG